MATAWKRSPSRYPQTPVISKKQGHAPCFLAHIHSYGKSRPKPDPVEGSTLCHQSGSSAVQHRL
jgi:hypothetical protein